MPNIFEKPSISIENRSFLIDKPNFSTWNSNLDRKTKYFKFRNQVFRSLYRKTKLFNRKTWFFHQAPGNHMSMQPVLIQRSTEKSTFPATVFIVLTLLKPADSNMEGTGDLSANFTSSVSDTRHGKGFRAFLNSPFGRVYFDNNKEEEGGKHCKEWVS